MKIQPFDQPDVESAKISARAVLKKFEELRVNYPNLKWFLKKMV